MVVKATSTIFQIYRCSHKSQVTDKRFHIMLYRVHHARAGFELTTLVVNECK